MYDKYKYEDAYYNWYSKFGGCELEPEERGAFFYKLISQQDEEDACSWAGIDYNSDDWQDDLDVAKNIAYLRKDDVEFAESMDWTYGG